MNQQINVKIKEIAVYHPKKVEDNQFYIEHFKKQGKDVEHFIRDVAGRDKRYLIERESDENTLTMAIAAAKMVLEKADLRGDEVDMVCLASLSAEYNMPPTAFKIYEAIHGNEHAICYDINLNCLGMCFAFDQISRYMQTSDSVKRVLLVGSEYMNYMIPFEDETVYGMFGDAACAVILEKEEGESELLNTSFASYPNEKTFAQGPYCGYSHMLSADKKDMLYWQRNHQPDMGVAADGILKLLEKCHVDKSQVKLFCLSQALKMLVDDVSGRIQAEPEQILYVGDKYGYTGCTSPFIVLYEAIQQNRVQRGDYIVFWTIGMATQQICMLIRY